MRAVDIIRTKRDGLELSPQAIATFVDAATHGRWPDYQLTAMLMAIWLRGMSPSETAELTRAMVESGAKLDWSDLPGPKVDKHSTGGVGDKTSLILAPIVAACGAYVPMMSGRGLGHTGGTLDKLESIPGFRVSLSFREMWQVMHQVGFAMIGQTATVAPADKKLYALRDASATVESIPLITASILSKKIAEGIDALVLDVKVGRGAFMKTEADARALAKSLVEVGEANHLRTEALLTSMDVPLGRAVGNALEVIECVEILRGHPVADDTRDLSLRLAERMLLLSGVVETEAEAATKVRHALDSGRALERFRKMVELQGGDPRAIDQLDRLPRVATRHLVRAPQPGYIIELDAEKIGQGAMRLGAGRDRAEDQVDPAVGVQILVQIGEQVRPGDPVLEVHYRDMDKLDSALELLESAVRLGPEPEAPPPRIRGSIRGRSPRSEPR